LFDCCSTEVFVVPIENYEQRTPLGPKNDSWLLTVISIHGLDPPLIIFWVSGLGDGRGWSWSRPRPTTTTDATNNISSPIPPKETRENHHPIGYLQQCYAQRNLPGALATDKVVFQGGDRDLNIPRFSPTRKLMTADEASATITTFVPTSLRWYCTTYTP
jgi:hypothetical protein